MALPHILVFTAFCLLAGFVLPTRLRLPALLAGSVLAVYWLQPALPIRSLDFWLPTAALALTVLVWAITQRRPAPDEKTASERPGNRSLFETGLLVGVVFLIGLTRYIEPLCCLTPSRPPEMIRILAVLGIAGLVVALPARVLPRNWRLQSQFLLTAASLLILALFVVLKSEPLARGASALLRTLSGQDAALASSLDLSWLGFSYLAFRLLRALRDFQNGRLPAYTLGEFVTYAVFFPAYTAGPIDRSQHFITELRQAGDQAVDHTERASRLQTGTWRILWGVFKKFAVADSLALFALNAQNAAQVNQPGWAWVLLYAYALRIYFDFSGYTDIALGLARLVGISLPENFDRPYLRTNLTAFWNSWHITLAQWFRAYFFNPVTRALRSRRQGGRESLPTWLVILIGQMGVMVLIGLWHGITWNFLIWGAWHGLGLFVHNRWSGWIRPRLPDLPPSSNRSRLLAAGGWAATFNYVALGWVWFALPTPGLALTFLNRLLGI